MVRVDGTGQSFGGRDVFVKGKSHEVIVYF